MSTRGKPYSTGDEELDRLIAGFVGSLPERDQRLAQEIVTTALKLAREQVNTLDRKIVNSTLKELRHAFRVFHPYKGIRKVTMFGSARSSAADPEYAVARDFSREIADRGWMVITGAGPGIMEAGQEGAGKSRSFGVNILLPFEATPNPHIADDAKLINFKYFFTRKLTFVKEADGFVLLPGGFGTLDEAFELLTLVQTGKATLQPIVLLDRPGGGYWANFDRFLRNELLKRNYISEDDLSLYRICDDYKDAVDEITAFYTTYHSNRIVGERLIFRLNHEPNDDALRQLSSEFSDILDGPIERTSASKSEIADDDVPDLPRIALRFDMMHTGRLRLLVDRLNALHTPSAQLR
ncbi:MAG TPA: TIGR00730 family Rossman fold protein [Actinomycetota bacterium]|nr:TIGR00730 family Rossman fold protein [Actinomycetota bacterium]